MTFFEHEIAEAAFIAFWEARTDDTEEDARKRFSDFEDSKKRAWLAAAKAAMDKATERYYR